MTHAEIQKVCKKLKIKSFTINPDGSVDVRGNVDASIADFYKGKLPIKFGKIEGDFVCDGMRLRSLENAPHTVTGTFDCSWNEIQSLEGGPHTVGDGYFCDMNPLESLKYAPTAVPGEFDCSDCDLVSLEGCPVTVGDRFTFIHNALQSLEHAPKSAGSWLGDAELSTGIALTRESILAICQVKGDIRLADFMGDITSFTCSKSG